MTAGNQAQTGLSEMALGLIEEAAFRPNLSGLALDLGVAGFDAILRARQAEFLASIGFEG